MTNRSRELTVLAMAATSLVVLYFDVLVKLVDAWTNDGNYSHGFLIVPLAGYFAWERRDRLARAARQPSILGFIVVAGSLAVLVVGILGSELFLTRISLLGAIGGSLLFLFGWQVIRILAFPLGILLLMVPLPAIIFNQITFPLQLWASEFGEFVLNTSRIPVLREGNVLILANTTLEVAEACSGIRSLISLLTLGIVFGYFTDSAPDRPDADRPLHDPDRDFRQRGQGGRDGDCRALLRLSRGRGLLPRVLRMAALPGRLRAARARAAHHHQFDTGSAVFRETGSGRRIGAAC